VKSYRPVALLNPLGKVIELIIAERISHAVEIHNLLPAQYMGGRRGVSTEEAVHILLERMRTSWKIRPLNTASVLFLDVSGALDHVSHEGLLNNLRERRLDLATIGWVRSFPSKQP
jgi:hypothetical protein